MVSRRDLGELVERVLAPVLGGNLARAAIRAQLARLGAATDDVGPEHTAPLLLGLEKGLRVFVGSPKAAALIAEVRIALEEATHAR